MPYNPSTGIYTLPSIYLAVPGTTIIAAQHNDPLVDLQTANNYPRPVIAGGTGATTPAGARANLEVVSDAVAVTYTNPSVDNVVPRWNGTDGALQDSALTIDDSGNATLVSTEAGAAAGPILTLDRDSTSPAASDVIGLIRFTGEDSVGNDEVYAEDQAVILDPTSTSEDGKRVIRTKVAGTLADRVHVGAGLWMEGATGTDKGSGTINATGVYESNVQIKPFVAGTAQASTSGTSIDFTGIPSWVKRISVMFNGVSTNGTSDVIVQIGDSGGIESTGYVSTASASTAFESSTAGFNIFYDSATTPLSGILTIELCAPATNTWVSSHALARGSFTSYGGGSKSLSATLDRIRLTTEGGSDTFDAGLVNISYD